jgi:negative regulator of flagellin synthesis FlgM
MKIDNNTNNPVVLLETPSKPSSVKANNDSQTGSQKTVNSQDKVELSAWKDEVSRLKGMMQTIPSTNTDKVTQIKNAIDAGTYNVKGQVVAGSMLKSNLLDEIL